MGTSLSRIDSPPPPSRIGYLSGRICGTGGMHLAFTQEDFLVLLYDHFTLSHVFYGFNHGFDV